MPLYSYGAAWVAKIMIDRYGFRVLTSLQRCVWTLDPLAQGKGSK